ncbi:peroxisome biogenesis factor 13 isoform X2 [Narcine bancroftii]|uniref:peroxisome biogenesis factor 13 isoform X2 n=1 Tax=Narcine bancroftii TaxID=1343680 RepID=UPI00383125E3
MGSQPPPKPWERRIPGSVNVPSLQSAYLVSGLPSRQGQNVVTRIPPPVPPRSSQQSGVGNLSTYRSAYNTFSPSYTPYGSYTPYSYGYGVSTSWANGEDDHIVGRAEYDFTAGTEEELSFRSGDMFNLAPKDQQPKVRGWLLACLDGQTIGLVPANYVRILGKRRGRRQVELEHIAKNQPQRPDDSTAGTSLKEQEAVLESAFSETSKQNTNSDAVDSINAEKDIIEV